MLPIYWGVLRWAEGRKSRFPVDKLRKSVDKPVKLGKNQYFVRLYRFLQSAIYRGCSGSQPISSSELWDNQQDASFCPFIPGRAVESFLSILSQIWVGEAPSAHPWVESHLPRSFPHIHKAYYDD